MVAEWRDRLFPEIELISLEEIRTGIVRRGLPALRDQSGGEAAPHHRHVDTNADTYKQLLQFCDEDPLLLSPLPRGVDVFSQLTDRPSYPVTP